MRVSLCFLLGVWQETVKQQARNFSRLSLHLGTHTHTSGTQGKTVKEDLQATVCTMFSELVVRQAVSKNTDPPYMCKATKTNFSPFFLYWGSGQVFYLPPSILFGELHGPTLLLAPTACHSAVRTRMYTDVYAET